MKFQQAILVFVFFMGSLVSPAFADDEKTIYWSDADSGRLGDLKFRIANKDAPETGSLKQRGGAKCEAERALGYEAKAYMVGFTKGKEIKIERDYGEDRYGRGTGRIKRAALWPPSRIGACSERLYA